jgi:hypothetical protein
VPNTDIFETNSWQSVILEPTDGRLNFAKYESMQPLYSEYGIGRSVSFSLSNKIDQSKVGTEMKGGVLTVALPKAQEAKPRTMTVG